MAIETLRGDRRYQAHLDDAAAAGDTGRSAEWGRQLLAFLDAGNTIRLGDRSFGAADLRALFAMDVDARPAELQRRLGENVDYNDFMRFCDDVMRSHPGARATAFSLAADEARRVGVIDAPGRRATDFGAGPARRVRVDVSEPTGGGTGLRAGGEAVAAPRSADEMLAAGPLRSYSDAVSALPEAQRAAVRTLLASPGFQALDSATQSLLLSQATTTGVDARALTALSTIACAAPFARMSPTDRAAVLAIFEQVTPGARDALATLVGRERDGTSALSARSPASGPTMLESFTRLLTASVPGDTGAHALAGLIREVANPAGEIDQGNCGSCVAASMSAALAEHDPAEYARLVSALLVDGSATSLGGTLLRAVPGYETARPDERVLNPAVTDRTGDGRVDERDTDLDGDGRPWDLGTFRNMSDGRTVSERVLQAALLDAAGSGYDPATDRRPDGSSGMSGAATRTVMGALFGGTARRYTFTSDPRDPASTAVPARSGEGPGRGLVDRLLALGATPGPVLVSINPSVTGSVGHELVFAGSTGGRIVLRDPNMGGDGSAAVYSRVRSGEFTYPGTSMHCRPEPPEGSGRFSVSPEDLAQYLVDYTVVG